LRPRSQRSLEALDRPPQFRGVLLLRPFDRVGHLLLDGLDVDIGERRLLPRLARLRSLTGVVGVREPETELLRLLEELRRPDPRLSVRERRQALEDLVRQRVVGEP